MFGMAYATLAATLANPAAAAITLRRWGRRPRERPEGCNSPHGWMALAGAVERRRLHLRLSLS
jgi:hypothetical protein